MTPLQLHKLEKEGLTLIREDSTTLLCLNKDGYEVEVKRKAHLRGNPKFIFSKANVQKMVERQGFKFHGVDLVQKYALYWYKDELYYKSYRTLYKQVLTNEPFTVGRPAQPSMFDEKAHHEWYVRHGFKPIQKSEYPTWVTHSCGKRLFTASFNPSAMFCSCASTYS